jgi:hypothetical protein
MVLTSDQQGDSLALFCFCALFSQVQGKAGQVGYTNVSLYLLLFFLMIKPASLSTLPGTATMVAAMTTTMTMTKKKKMAVAVSKGNSKFPISKI